MDDDSKTTVRQGQDGQWYYRSADPLVDGQAVGKIRPQWVDEVIATADWRYRRDKLARELCVAAGHHPDAIGDPPRDDGVATLDHAFPRWVSWRHEANRIMEALGARR